VYGTTHRALLLIGHPSPAERTTGMEEELEGEDETEMPSIDLSCL